MENNSDISLQAVQLSDHYGATPKMQHKGRHTNKAKEDHVFLARGNDLEGK